MTTTFTIYHNPKCSKSRQTLALLESHNITPSVVEYLGTPPDSDAISEMLDLLAVTPRDIMRPKEDAYIEANLDDTNLSDAQLINAMIEHPRIIERPIVVKYESGQAVAAIIGRPPENVLGLLE